MNSLNGVTVIGLTGQSGAGKTTVCDVFEKNGFSIINADKIAREVVKLGSPCLKNINDVFPECIDELTGELDRKKTADLVFNDKGFLKIFNSIMYPYITTKILSEFRRLADGGSKYILLDAPTLFESRTDDFCNYIVCIIADEKLRLDRILSRDKISKESILSRFASQHSDDYYINRSDVVLCNNGSIDELTESAELTVSRIKEMFHA